MFSPLSGGAAGHSYRLLLDPAPTEGGGSNPPPPAKEADKTPPAADPTEGFKTALAKHNNDGLALARESYAAAESLRTQLAQTQGKLPKEGSVVLSAEDAAAWAEIKKLGKPDAIKATIAEHGTLKTQVAQRARQDLYSEIGKAHDWNPAAIADVPGIDGMDLVLEDGTRNGKPSKIAHVRETTKDGDGKEVTKKTPLEKHIRDTRPHLLPALTAGQGQPARTQGGPARQVQKPSANPGADAGTQRQARLARW